MKTIDFTTMPQETIDHYAHHQALATSHANAALIRLAAMLTAVSDALSEWIDRHDDDCKCHYCTYVDKDLIGHDGPDQTAMLREMCASTRWVCDTAVAVIGGVQMNPNTRDVNPIVLDRMFQLGLVEVTTAESDEPAAESDEPNYVTT